MSKHIPVLIIGAGPTGLTMACELAHHGIPFKIIDQNPEHTLGANAVWVQPRTLELLDQMGIASRFINAGNPCHAINLNINGKPLVSIPLNQIDSPYPYILMLPQSETERLLLAHLSELKHHVDRNYELVDIKQSDNEVISTIRLSDGKTKTITSDW